ncbi:pre-16S rRNA-processing nuclease YqgF [Candidatus Nomurabacteria bacterium]|nr:pre-16S rRNA-processing nuclease YqgF [Candidatus Nomurabacteria bacterium]
MKYLGIDVGTVHTGFAVGDDSSGFAFPKEVVPAKEALDAAARLCKEEHIGSIVIGQSLASNEVPNEVQFAIQRFAQQLQEHTGITQVFEREDFSSVEAHRYQQSSGRQDDSAAAIILQRFLDKQKRI